MHIARVGLRVFDLARSLEFYTAIVGLRVREREDGSATLGAPDGGPVLLTLRRAARPGPAPQHATGLFHTAFRYPTRGGLGAALARLVETRYPLAGASDHLVSEALYLDDPDGLGVELYRDRPRDEWPQPPAGQRVRMDTLPLDLRDVLESAEGELPESAAGAQVGHVHLKVADVEQAVDFWTEWIGMELMARYGTDAAFLADGGYHHHIGANTWLSKGARREPEEGPGLDEVVIATSGGELEGLRRRLGEKASSCGDAALETRTPDDVRVIAEAS
jgi:catechol 2,3-dioxygenase